MSDIKIVSDKGSPKIIPEKPKIIQHIISSRPVQQTTFQKPTYRFCIAVITANVNGQRIVLRTMKVPTLKEVFQLKGRSYLIDLSKAFMVSNKGAYLMYDIDISEPLDKTVGSTMNLPIELGDNVHYSKHVDLIMQGQLISQLVRSLGQPSAINLIAIILMIVGVALGYFMGVAMPFKTTTTTTTTAAKILFNLGWWMR